MRSILWLVIPAFIILMFACQVPGGPEDLPPPEEAAADDMVTETIQVKSIRPGQFISEQEAIPIEINMEDLRQEPAEVVINLSAADGTVVAEQKHFFEDGPEKVSLPDLLLPKIPEGQYTLHYLFYNKSGELFYEEEVPFFYITRNYEISGIRSFPNAIRPRSTAMLKAGITAPEGSDPYLRWKLGDIVAAEGYFSEGARLFSWIAPEVEGIYSVSLELFPVMPTAEMAFSSEIRMVTEMYVTSEPKPDRSELQPEEDYYSLFHFRGNTLDTGYRNNPGKASLVGAPELRLEGETYGYHLDGASGFSVRELLLPVKGTTLQPFSLVLKGIIDPFAPEQTFFTAAADDGSFSFWVGTDSTGRLQAAFSNKDTTAVSTVPAAAEGRFQKREEEAETIILSVVSDKQPVTILWYSADSFLHGDALSFKPELGNTAGKAVIGGTKGFTGLLDEFGIYHNRRNTESSIIENMYEASLAEEFGLDLRFAEGFDGYALPEHIEYSGEVDLRKGTAALKAGAALKLPPVLLRNEAADISVELDGTLPAEEGFICRVEFPDTEIPAVVLDIFDGSVIGGEKIDPADLLHEKKIEFTLIHSAEGVILTVGEKQIPLFDKPDGSVDIILSLQNGTEQTVFVEGISIISTSEEIVQKNTGVPLQSPETEDSSLAAGEQGESQIQDTIL